MEADWGFKAARTLFAEKNIVQERDFDQVWWEGLQLSMSKYPKMYRVWLTKYLSEFSGINVQMYYWSKGKHSLKCKFCRTEDKYTMHICRCQDSGRTSMFHMSVKELTTWLILTLGEHCIATTIKQYLMSCGETRMVDCMNGTNQDLHAVAIFSDRLGYDSLLEGRISKLWLTAAALLLLRPRQYLLPLAWGRQFINKFHNIIHKQWMYRNSVIHYRGKDGLTMPDHHEILNWVEEHAFTNPDSLLLQHKYLLDTDFEALGSGSTPDQLHWLADMRSAIAASGLSRAGTLTPEVTAHFEKVE